MEEIQAEKKSLEEERVKSQAMMEQLMQMQQAMEKNGGQLPPEYLAQMQAAQSAKPPADVPDHAKSPADVPKAAPQPEPQNPAPADVTSAQAASAQPTAAQEAPIAPVRSERPQAQAQLQRAGAPQRTVTPAATQRSTAPIPPVRPEAPKQTVAPDMLHRPVAPQNPVTPSPATAPVHPAPAPRQNPGPGSPDKAGICCTEAPGAASFAAETCCTGKISQQSRIRRPVRRQGKERPGTEIDSNKYTSKDLRSPSGERRSKGTDHQQAECVSFDLREGEVPLLESLEKFRGRGYIVHHYLKWRSKL